MMIVIVVTGGAGFIGSNIVEGLNGAGRDDVLVVDNLADAQKVKNLVGLGFMDYMDKEDFLQAVFEEAAWLGEVDAIIHQGACSSTTEADGRYVMRNNHDYSKALLYHCLEEEIPMLYASSAATYGGGSVFVEEPKHENPLNVYGLSKALFDAVVRRVLPEANSQIVGFRYFNVYGPREAHKGPMASMVLQLDDQLQSTGTAQLFGASPGYEAGEQRRDFVYVRDVVDVALWFLEHPECSGIFNCGTGTTRTFRDLAEEVIRFHGSGEIEYIPFPDSLQGTYQGFTQADLKALRAAGYAADFATLEQGIPEYLAWRRENELS